MTLQTLITNLTTFAGFHDQINSFTFGPIDELDIAKDGAENYPILYAVPSGVDIEKGQMSIDLDFIIATPFFDEDRTDVLQNTLSIMGDLIAYATQSTNQTNGLSGIQDPSVLSEPPFLCEPFLVRFDNALIGWSTTLTFGCDYENNFCLVP